MEGKSKARVAQLSCPLLEELILTGVPPISNTTLSPPRHKILQYAEVEEERFMTLDRIDGWMDESIDQCIDRWIDRLIDRWIDQSMGKLIE